LLPGSRRSEVDMIAPSFLEAAARMQQRRNDLRFLLPAAPAMEARLAPLMARHSPAVRIDRIDGRSHQVLAACDVAVVASGTATLEAALFKRPMVIAYRMNPLSWEIMKRMQLQPWVGLPNILLRDFAVPELIQSKATPDAIADETLRWLDDPAAVRQLEARFAGMHLQLRCDTARAATDAIAQTLGR
jgi:lipid-A-disaccharide synthase